MSFKPLALFRSNADLATFMQSAARFPNISEARKSVPIAIIDDQPFRAEQNLRSYGFNIAQIGDVKRIDEVKDYRIVLCDLMGVGSAMGSASEGAELISEIRRQFPGILVAAYTGAALNSTQARAAKTTADRLLKKDMDNAEWQEELDGFIRQALDPHLLWKRMRRSLVEADLDTKSILVLEDAFVRTIVSRDKSGKAIESAVTSLNLAGDVRAVARSLVSSAIFFLAFGG